MIEAGGKERMHNILCYNLSDEFTYINKSEVPKLFSKNLVET